MRLVVIRPRPSRFAAALLAGAALLGTTPATLAAQDDDSPLHGFAMVLHLGTFSDRRMRWSGSEPDSRGELVWRTAPTVALSFDVARMPAGRPGPVLIGGFGFRTLIHGGQITQQDLMVTINGSIGLAF